MLLQYDSKEENPVRVRVTKTWEVDAIEVTTVLNGISVTMISGFDGIEARCTPEGAVLVIQKIKS